MKCEKCNFDLDSETFHRLKANDFEGEKVCYDCKIKDKFKNLDEVMDGMCGLQNKRKSSASPHVLED